MPRSDLDRSSTLPLVKPRYYKLEQIIDLLTTVIILTTDIVITIVIINLELFLGIGVLCSILRARFNFAVSEARRVKTHKICVTKRVFLVPFPFPTATVTLIFRQLVA